MPLAKQVLVLAKGDKPFAIYPVSSGKPSTPTVTGHFSFFRQEPGYNSEGMYYSFYFYGGYAVHGYASVPDYPASHGCVRTFIADQPGSTSAPLRREHLRLLRSATALIGERALRRSSRSSPSTTSSPALIALVAPDTFFDQIGHYGIENSHYVGDVGAFMLAFGVAIGIAVVRPAWRAPLLWLGALWYGFHAINHAFDTGEAKSEARGWTDTLLLAFGGVAAAWLARVSERLNGEGRRAGGAE